MGIVTRRQKARKSRQAHVRAPYKLRVVIRGMKLPETLLTYRAVAAEISRRSGIAVTHGAVYRLANGVEPKRAEIRRAFKLPELIPVAACAKCGKIHRQQKSCENKRRRVRRLHELPAADIARRLRDRFDYAPTDAQREAVAALYRKRVERIERLRRAAKSN